MNRGSAAKLALLASLSLSLVSGCGSEGAGPADQQTATGEPVAAQDFFGWQFQPCTQLELDGYPTNISRASGDYYQGPWCARDGSTRLYLWAYAREMTDGLTLEEVQTDVTLDAEQLTLDLAAQGYLRICGEVVGGGPVDVALEEPDSPQQIRIAAVGQTPISAADQPAQPLALLVAVGPASGDPAFPPELSAPACRQLGTAEVTVTSGGPGVPSPAQPAQ